MRPGAYLFHGTTAEFDEPQPSGYDGCFWTARTSTVAQTYIPAAGLLISTSYMSNQDLDLHVRPGQGDAWYSLVLQMGHRAREIEWDPQGRAKSFVIPRGYPTYRQVVHLIEEDLGYKSLHAHSPLYLLKSTGWIAEEGRDQIAPASYQMPGWLWIVSGWDGLKIFDLSSGREGDLNSPDYHRTGLFRRLERDGYDGVAIRDFAQSKNHGNVEHEAIGFFRHAIASLTLERVPAVNFDWPENGCCFDVEHTPEFLQWASKRERRASLSL